MIPLHGSCHCGNIRFVLEWPESSAEIPVRMCGCSFCQMHQGAWTSNRDARLNIQIKDDSLVSKYRFGTKTADFYVCSACGIVPFVLCDVDESTYAVVSVNAIGNTGDFDLSKSATNFDGEDTGSRLERRQRNWIPTVRFGA